jgi:hypothetical protein
MLALLPLGDGLHLFQSQLRKDQVRITGLKSEGFGFIKREADQMLVSSTVRGKLPEDSLLRPLELIRDFFAAGPEAGELFGCEKVRFHVSSYLFSQIYGQKNFEIRRRPLQSLPVFRGSHGWLL